MMEYILKKLADVAFANVSAALKTEPSMPTTSPESLEAALQHHIREVKNWSGEISFSDLKSAKRTAEVFVPLDLMLQPRRLRIDSKEQSEIQPLEQVLADTNAHIIILGQPGAGKTTSMKHLCHRLMTDESFLPQIHCPIVIRLRELSTRYNRSDRGRPEALFAALQEIFDLDVSRPQLPRKFKPHERYLEELHDVLEKRQYIRRTALVEILDSVAALLVLDGFDEIPSVEMRDSLIEGVRELAPQLEVSRIILTSRTGEFTYHVENMAQFELHPLTDSQI